MTPHRLYSIITVVAVLSYSCEKVQEVASIQLSFNDSSIDTLFLSLTPYDDPHNYQFDTLPLYAGEFAFDTAITTLKYGIIVCSEMYSSLVDGSDFLFRSKVVEFFLHPNEILTIEADIKDDRTDFVLNGDALNLQRSKYMSSSISYKAEQSQLMYDYENLFLNEVSTDDMFLKLESRMGELYNETNESNMAFIREHPDYELSAFLLQQFPKDTILKYHELLDGSVFSLPYGVSLSSKIEAWERIAVGKLAPEFKYQTISGIDFRSTDYSGKYLVLHFWGSWCAPCIGGIPKMKDYHLKYSESVEFMGIACRDKLEPLKEAVEKHGIEWDQILNQADENDLSKLFAIQGYPTKIIINAEGVIEGIFLGETGDFYFALDQLCSTSP